MTTKTKTRPATIPTDGPTTERLAKADIIEHGQDERGRPTVTTVRDGTIERMRARGAISDLEYSAAIKYLTHWEFAGLSPHMASIDADRIHAVDFGAYSHMAKNEFQAHHREIHRLARSKIGNLPAAALEQVLCFGGSLEQLGLSFRWHMGPAAIRAAQGSIIDSLRTLVAHWGLRPPAANIRDWRPLA